MLDGRRARAATRLGAALAVLSCASARAEARTPSPSLTAIQNSTYHGVYKTPVTLQNGVSQGPAAAGSSSHSRVELVRDGIARGAILGPGSLDAAVLLAESSGGSGSFVYLAVMTAKGSTATNVATVRIGDRVQVRSLTIDSGAIVLDLVAHAPEDPMCCPTAKVKRSWRLRGDSLVVASSSEEGRISARDLEGRTWRLTLLDRNQPVPRGVTITAAFAGGKIQGSAGCNRYSAEVEGADASERIAFGPIAATRMACADPAGSFERRYLAALQGAQQFGFLVGKLALSYRIGERYGVMMFVSDSTASR